MPTDDWTHARRVEAAIDAPRVRALHRPDTQVIERPGWFQIVTPSARGYLNHISHSRVEAHDAERVIDDELARYRRAGVTATWSVGSWTAPGDFGARPAARGFAATESVAMGMLVGPMSTPARVTVELVEHDAQIAAHMDLSVRGWSMPEDQRAPHEAMMRATLTKSPRLAFMYNALLDGEPVGTAALVLRADYGYLMGGQVLEGARGKGVYRATVAARLDTCRALGVRYVVTHARATTSAPILERIGFETLFRSEVYAIDPRA